MIIDVPNSGVALAVSQIAAQKNKVFIVSGAAASDLTGAEVQRQHRALDLRHLDAGQRHRQGDGEDRRRHLVLPHRRLRLRPCARARHRGGGRGERRQGARQGAPSAQHQRLLVVPAAGADLEGQGHRPRQRRRRHHQLDQAGGRVRHRQGRAEVRRPAGVRERRQRARPADRAGPDADRDLVLGRATTPTAPGPSAGRPSATPRASSRP